MSEHERCCECDEPTGRAGRGDDSLYHDARGPFCQDCYDKAMTTPTDLPARVEEALRAYAQLAELESLPDADRSEREVARYMTKRHADVLFPALAADWQRLRERERVLTEALRGASEALYFVEHLDPDSIKPARARILAALSPEPKT